jgi:transcriptional regulator with XRE-family HTH domain
MTVGETLARARRDAGLSIAEISLRTRIRQSIIDGIEHDDYSASGGDFYARGNIRAIAQALRLDSEPLVEAYDAARRPGEWIVAAERSEPIIAARAPEPRGSGEEFGPVTADDDTQPITMHARSEPVTAGEPRGPVTAGEPLGPVTAGQSLRPVTAGGPSDQVMAAEESEPDWMSPQDRRRAAWIALGATVLVVAGVGGLILAVGTSGHQARHASSAGRRDSGGRGATQQAAARPSPSLPSPAGRRPGRALVPASIAAFGPGGAGQGDSPQLASQALAGKPAQPWHSAWYTTARFGNLQSGTGLLLDMGRTVTITAARIALGRHQGANFALRIGNSPDLASLPPVARAKDAAGVVRLRTAPTRGRYVLVWFTRLPPDPAGTFQVFVYDIKLRGYP